MSYDEIMMSRRAVCATGAAAASMVMFPRRAWAQARPKYRRLSVTNPDAGRHLDSYKRAIRAMLALPPSDARNWYRIALIHTLDCPHGNWWFLVWHRAYLGWFEQICRDLSGDSEFALPYWDWTEHPDPSKPFSPRVPEVLFEDVLTPTHSAFIGKYDEFKARYQDSIARADYWKRIHADGVFDNHTQYGQLLARAMRFPDDLWFDIIDDPRRKIFFDGSHARGLTRQHPHFDERTTNAVSLPMLLSALSPRDFITFASPKTLTHNATAGYGVLEGQPHNKVHNNVGGISFKTVGNTTTKTNVGGFMQGFLSPVDPLFFLHHSNIDRLWDVWTRKQQLRGYPILPDGYPKQPGDPVPRDSDYELWSGEPFLFFIDARGQPVTKTKAGDYAAIGDFDYDYQPGSGEEIGTPPVASAPVASNVQQFGTRISRSLVSAASAAVTTITVPPGLLRAASDPGTPQLLAKVTIALGPHAHADELVVVVAGSDNTPGAGTEAIPLSVVGHHAVHCPLTFTVPLSAPLKALHEKRLLPDGAPLRIRVATDASSHRSMSLRHMNASAEVISLVVEAH